MEAVSRSSRVVSDQLLAQMLLCAAAPAKGVALHTWLGSNALAVPELGAAVETKTGNAQNGELSVSTSPSLPPEWAPGAFARVQRRDSVLGVGSGSDTRSSIFDDRLNKAAGAVACRFQHPK